MQERSLLKLFLVLNAALAGGFAVYLFITHAPQPTVELVSFATTKTNPAVRATNLISIVTNAPAITNVTAASTTAAGTNAPAPKPTFSNRRFTWQDVESDAYRTYLESLRAVGCPEERVRSIVKADIEELFADRRLKEAVAQDTRWWTNEPMRMFVNAQVGALAEKGRTLENQRLALVEKLLGPDVAEKERDVPVFWSNVPLSGPVLGKLDREKHTAVQEICGRSIERSYAMQAARWAQFNDPQAQVPTEVDLAKMREQTRSEIRKVLTPEEQEEFLLRYSQVSHNLATELAGFDPSPEEFRKIFRAVDPIDHKLHLEFGSAAALSPQQRERYERQRSEVIRGALSPERYQAFLVAKDPLYRQAKMTASQMRAPSEAFPTVYALVKTNETRRQKILAEAARDEQQRTAALQALSAEHQRIIADAALDPQKKREALQEISVRQQKLLVEASLSAQQRNAAMQQIALQQQKEMQSILNGGGATRRAN
jgi:hypothetical protein